MTAVVDAYLTRMDTAGATKLRVAIPSLLDAHTTMIVPLLSVFAPLDSDGIPRKINALKFPGAVILTITLASA